MTRIARAFSEKNKVLVAYITAGDPSPERTPALVAAMEKTTIDSPRGKFTLSKAHNPIQDIYLRKVEGLENKYVSVAAKALADPARGCKMV